MSGKTVLWFSSVYYNENRSVTSALIVDDRILAGYNKIEMIKMLNKLNRPGKIVFQEQKNSLQQSDSGIL